MGGVGFFVLVGRKIENNCLVEVPSFQLFSSSRVMVSNQFLFSGKDEKLRHKTAQITQLGRKTVRIVADSKILIRFPSIHTKTKVVSTLEDWLVI